MTIRSEEFLNAYKAVYIDAVWAQREREQDERNRRNLERNMPRQIRHGDGVLPSEKPKGDSVGVTINKVNRG